MLVPRLSFAFAALVLAGGSSCGLSVTNRASNEEPKTEETAPAPKPFFDGDCATIRDQYQNKTQQTVSWMSWADAFAGCGRYDAIFEDLAHWGDLGPDGEGAKGLIEMEGKGIPLREEFKKYLDTHRGEAFLPIKHVEYAASHIGVWLQKDDDASFCAPIAASIDQKSTVHIASFLKFFERAGCKAEIEKLGAELFLSKVPTHRNAICRIVGELGLKSFEKKTSILATTDESYEIRNTCRAAIGKLKLRQ